MSRSGRPSARGKRGSRQRNLLGPREILDQIEQAGGIPDRVVEELTAPRPANPLAEAANEAVVAAIQAAAELAANLGIEHETFERADRADDASQVARELAWHLSVTNAMKEAAPREKWCRHMRAAYPKLPELRTIAALSAGIWLCVECMRAAPAATVDANPWPNECDLCGATMTPGHFNQMTFNIPGCLVSCAVCDECYDFTMRRSK